MALNPTYKHLEASLRIGAFTLGQWAQILVAAVMALLFGVYLSPLPLTITIFVSIVLAGGPLALSYGAMAQEWSVLEALRAQWRWLRHPRRYLPGPGPSASGYRVDSPINQAEGQSGRPQPRRDARAGAVWDY